MFQSRNRFLIFFETIASNRNLIIPNFHNENKIKKNVLHNIRDKKYLVNSKKKLYKKINYYLNLNYKNKKISSADIKTLRYYMGNTNGMSGRKMQKFINKIFL